MTIENISWSIYRYVKVWAGPGSNLRPLDQQLDFLLNAIQARLAHILICSPSGLIMNIELGLLGVLFPIPFLAFTTRGTTICSPSGFVMNIELGLLGVLFPIPFLAFTWIWYDVWGMRSTITILVVLLFTSMAWPSFQSWSMVLKIIKYS